MRRQGHCSLCGERWKHDILQRAACSIELQLLLQQRASSDDGRITLGMWGQPTNFANVGATSERTTSGRGPYSEICTAMVLMISTPVSSWGTKLGCVAGFGVTVDCSRPLLEELCDKSEKAREHRDISLRSFG